MRQTIKQRIFDDLKGSETDSNHVTRRMFRCWLEGSYLGEEHYRQNVADLKKICDGGLKGFGIRMHSWAINQFTRYTAHDADCSYGYAQKCIVEFFKTRVNKEGFLEPEPEWDHFLWLYTEGLVDDALDLIEEYYYKARTSPKWDNSKKKKPVTYVKTETTLYPNTDFYKDLALYEERLKAGRLH